MQVLRHADKNDEHRKIAQKLRLNGHIDTLRWLVGLYTDKTRNQMRTRFTYVIPAMNMVAASDMDASLYAAFGSLTWHCSDHLYLTGRFAV